MSHITYGTRALMAVLIIRLRSLRLATLHFASE